jgi:hypothetical protein
VPLLLGSSLLRSGKVVWDAGSRFMEPETRRNTGCWGLMMTGDLRPVAVRLGSEGVADIGSYEQVSHSPYLKYQ